MTADRPVFVVGCGRSGTTMLFQMLKAHPNLVPTTGHPDGEDHVGWVKHGAAVIAGIYGNQKTGDTGSVVGHPVCLHMHAGHVTEDVRDAMHRYYQDEVLGGRSGPRVVNKCPHLSNKLAYVRGIFPQARFVHIIREPVAMTASWVNIMSMVPDLVLYMPDDPCPCLSVFARSGGLKNEALLAGRERWYPGGGPQMFADYWAATNGNIDAQVAGFADQLLTVRYEELVTQPEVVLRSITDFCGLDPFGEVPIAVDRHRNRLRTDLLTIDQVAEIERRTHDVAVRYGYA